MTTTTRKVGDSVGTASAKYPGWWKIEKINPTGRKLITVMPDAERGNTARRGVQLPPELVTDQPYDPMAFEFIEPGTVIRFAPSVVERKPSFAGLWVVTNDRNDTVTVFRLGGSTSKISGVHRATYEVVPLADLAEAIKQAEAANV